MGCDTKGVVLTSCKDAFFVVDRIREGLDNLIRPGYREECRKKGHFLKEGEPRRDFVLTQADFAYAGSGMVSIGFSYNGEHRSLKVFFECDCDYKALAEESLILSLGCWGQSDLLMKTALESLSMLGDVYFDLNDCDAVDLAKLEVAPHDFFSSATAGLHHGGTDELRKWKKLSDTGQLRHGSVAEVLGMPAQEVSRILAMPYAEAEEVLKARFA